MEPNQLQSLAAQLRKPEGEQGITIAGFMNKGNKKMNEDVIRALAPQPNEHILEIGMGNGLFVKDIVSQHPSIKYTGCDFSPLMVEESKKLNTELIKNEQTTFLLANAEQLPLNDSSVDKIFTVNTLYFWENPAKTLAEFKRVLVADGKLFISIRPKSVMDHLAFTQFGFTKYTEDDLIELLMDNSFEVNQTIVHEEPDMEVNGTIFKMENLVVIASNLK